MSKAKKEIAPPPADVKLTPKQAEKFWSYISKTKSCWIWNGPKASFGYGKMRAGGRDWKAHRISWVIHNGPIPGGLKVLHNCPSGDTPACVRPDHLFLGTQEDNMKDMAKKGRSPSGDNHFSRRNPEKMARGERHGSSTHPESRPKGEEHSMAKLDETRVREIRTRYRGGKTSQAKLAKEYEVCAMTICRIVNKQIWTHI